MNSNSAAPATAAPVTTLPDTDAAAAAGFSDIDDSDITLALIDESFNDDDNKFKALELEAIAAGAVPVTVEIDHKSEDFHPGKSFSVARPQHVDRPPNGSVPSITFKRLKKNKRFCLLNSEEMYDKRNPLEMEFYHKHLDSRMKQRQLTVYILEPRDRKANTAKRPKFDPEYSKYDTNGFYPFKYCK